MGVCVSPAQRGNKEGLAIQCGLRKMPLERRLVHAR